MSKRRLGAPQTRAAKTRECSRRQRKAKNLRPRAACARRARAWWRSTRPRARPAPSPRTSRQRRGAGASPRAVRVDQLAAGVHPRQDALHRVREHAGAGDADPPPRRPSRGRRCRSRRPASRSFRCRNCARGRRRQRGDRVLGLRSGSRRGARRARPALRSAMRRGVPVGDSPNAISGPRRAILGCRRCSCEARRVLRRSAVLCAACTARRELGFAQRRDLDRIVARSWRSRHAEKNWRHF